MTLVPIILFTALTFWALYKVVAPFLESRSAQLRSELLDEELEAIERLVARKSSLLQTLRDIEFDHDTGKLSEADYERLKDKYELKTLKVMRQLEELRGGYDHDEAIDEALRERADRLVERREETQKTTAEQQAAPAAPDRGLECPDCGRELASDAQFCSGCGLELERASESGDAQPDDDADDESGALEAPAPRQDSSEPNGTPRSELRSEPAG